MGFIANSENDFERHLPAPGVAPAVWVDIIDIGTVQTEFQGKVKHQPKITFVWKIKEKHPELDGPFRVYKTYTLSLDERAVLSEHLQAWKGGKAFTDEQRRTGVDLEKLLHMNCQLVLQHKVSKNNRTYVNVVTLMPAGEKIIPSGNYEPKIEEHHISAHAMKYGMGKMTSGDGAQTPPPGQPAPQAVAPAQVPTAQQVYAPPQEAPSGNYTFEPDDDLPF